MLRRAVVLCCAAMAMAGALVVPTSSSATTAGSLTVRTLGRDGKALAATVEAIEVGTLQEYSMVGGRARRLPRGTYDVLADIYESSNDQDTLGVKRVRVAGNTTITIDGRRGRHVTAEFRPAPAPGTGYQQLLTYAICDGNEIGDLAGVQGNDALYVIPSSIRSIGFGLGATWLPDTNSRSDRYAGTWATSGLPGRITHIFRTSSLATLRITGRSGPELGRAQFDLDREAGGTSCNVDLLETRISGMLPFAFTFHVAPGRWQVGELAHTPMLGRTHPYAAGRTYDLTVNGAAWGPGGELPYVNGAHMINLSAPTSFSDPLLGSRARATVHYRLSRAGHAIVDRTVGPGGSGPIAPVLHHAGWYTFTTTATRTVPPTALSTRSALRLRFYTDPPKWSQIRGYLPQFRPLALDRHNSVPAGRRTTVRLSLQRRRSNDPSLYPQLPDGVRRVQTSYSTDGGRSWHGLRVRHTNGVWSVVVPGVDARYVSLRATVFDTHGDTSSATVIRAFAVG